MVDSLGTYFSPNESGFATVIPGSSQTGLTQALMERRRFNTAKKAADKANKQKAKEEQQKLDNKFFDDLEGRLDWEGLNQYLDETQYQEFNSIFSDMRNLEAQSITMGAVDSQKKRALEQRANDFLFNREKTKLVVDSAKSIEEIAKAEGIYSQQSVASTFDKLFQEKGLSELDPESLKENVLFNPELIESSKVAEKVKESFAKQTRELITKSGGNILETTFKNQLPVVYEKTQDGQFRPVLDDNADPILDFSNPTLINVFKENKAFDVKAQQVRKQLQQTNPDATYQDAVKQILSGQNIIEETKTEKVDPMFMASFRNNLSQGQGAFSDVEIIPVEDVSYKPYEQIGADRKIGTQSFVAETPDAVKGVNFKVDMGDEAIGDEYSNDFDVEAFRVDENGDIQVRVQTKGLKSGTKQSIEIPADKRVLNAIRNKLDKKNDREGFNTFIENLEKSAKTRKDLYVDDEKLNAQVEKIKSSDPQSAVTAIKSLLPEASVEFSGKFLGAIGADEIVIDGVDYDISKQEDWDKIKGMILDKNPQKFSTDKAPSKKKPTSPTPKGISSDSTTTVTPPEQMVIQVNDSVTDVSGLFKQ